MTLIGVKKDNGWLYSEWRLTYGTGWDSICKAAELLYEYTEDPEVITGSASGSSTADIKKGEDILGLQEAGYLTIRGMSKIIEAPLSITFYNQTDLVRATVACATEEFREADYEKFNLSMCQFMDSAEIAMHS